MQSLRLLQIYAKSAEKLLAQKARLEFRHLIVGIAELPMAITLTDAAADRVKTFIENRGKGIGLRLGVRTTGCSGMAYVLEFADELDESDVVFEDNEVKVIVDPKSLVYLDGTELDFGKEGLNEGFKFKNPNVKDECGCGESFNV
jgi:iron-sulfur cluster assembly protein